MAEQDGSGHPPRVPAESFAGVLSPRILVAAGLTVLGLAWIGVTELTDSESVSERSPTTTSPEAQAHLEGAAAPVPGAPPTTVPAAPPTTTAPVGRTGVFVPAPPDPAVFGAAGELVTYSVAVEEATGVDPMAFAVVVDATLGDRRSWIAEGVRFQRVADGTAGVRIVLATPLTVDELCLPLQTNGLFSCHQGNQVNINLNRWLHGTEDWPLDVDSYHAHVINHEMGHALGHGHVGCPGPGQVAPVMMQQTKGLEGCVANPWPHPEMPAH